MQGHGPGGSGEDRVLTVVVHDYSGHPGQLHLSRELARRGVVVEHQFCASYTTGRGAVEARPGDPPTFTVTPVALRREFARYSPVVRVLQELQYATAAARALRRPQPDVVVLSNVPLLALLIVSTLLRLRRTPYVFWQQDVYSDAIATIARDRLGVLGALVGQAAARAERRVARGAAAVVTISESFLETLGAWGVPRERIAVVPNWAALDEMPLRDKDNPWSRAQGLASRPVVLYAGTLGLKHDPALLAELAAASVAEVVVVSEGRGRAWLEQASRDRGLERLRLMDFQPYAELPEVLAAADVLVVVLESDASRYSVPSKVLNYLCAGRAVLAVLPESNGVAQVVARAGAGLVVPPGDASAAVSALTRLLADDEWRADLGRAGRAYAERTFDVRAVGERFLHVLEGAVGAQGRGGDGRR